MEGPGTLTPGALPAASLGLKQKQKAGLSSRASTQCRGGKPASLKKLSSVLHREAKDMWPLLQYEKMVDHTEDKKKELRRLRNQRYRSSPRLNPTSCYRKHQASACQVNKGRAP